MGFPEPRSFKTPGFGGMQRAGRQESKISVKEAEPPTLRTTNTASIKKSPPLSIL